MTDEVTTDDIYPLYFDGIVDKCNKLSEAAEALRTFADRLDELDTEGYELVYAISDGYSEATPGGVEPIDPEEDEEEYEDEAYSEDNDE